MSTPALRRAADPIASFPPIALEDLVARAALLTRVDRKYVVPLDALADLLQALPDETRALEIDGQRSQRYRSVYRDTPDLASFHAAGRGRRLRWKVRTREYLDTGQGYLEVKTRGSRGTTVKERVPVGSPDAGSLVAARIGAGAAAALRPTLETTYRRGTLLLPSGARATIDRDLVVRSLLTGRSGGAETAAIVETKSGATPGELDRLLWRRGTRPVRISKYGAGLAAVHPELPRLKWHRVLDHHLTLPRPATAGLTAH
ncbi:polyphosphate polymerase domain-containing protein [Nocardioides sp. GY 10113]|uniref:polyphosphate polymerase domain-containing protein n=1 Tax=Nocardioides sp. GY 10113 TaxID=2569761 RepID=UPI0010A818F0|nr:polyphosphate polymerase domain-containing protein [Nocardioides sp. GY 10113]TIC86330.1 polyphosphate polymerase domain-containing protein [Nocardioides sp. GY 10113]